MPCRRIKWNKSTIHSLFSCFSCFTNLTDYCSSSKAFWKTYSICWSMYNPCHLSFLLLSYTSLASTSLQLLTPLTFKDVNKVRTYSSPDIKYFTSRHLIYGIVAILFEVIIVIGLPLFLLLEPFLTHLTQRINLVRIKPLLDEFQDSYKGKYRWFASYYLICRQVIFLIIYVGNGDYYKMLFYLQAACIIIAIIHICLQPYKKKFNLLNALDGVILLILVLVVNLNTFLFLSSALSIVLVVLPLVVLIFFVAIGKFLSRCCNKRNRIMHLFNPVEGYGEDEENDDYDDYRKSKVRKKQASS